MERKTDVTGTAQMDSSMENCIGQFRTDADEVFITSTVGKKQSLATMVMDVTSADSKSMCDYIIYQIIFVTKNRVVGLVLYFIFILLQPFDI